jgi:hypothetical protein
MKTYFQQQEDATPLAKDPRRSRRLPIEVPVHVYGRLSDNMPFRDFTRTISVNAYGGLLDVTAPVRRGQSVLLVHSITQEERECRIVYVGPESNGRRTIGVEFARPADNFWHVFFPLAGSGPTSQ